MEQIPIIKENPSTTYSLSDLNEFLRLPQFRGQFTLFSDQLNQPRLPNASNIDMGNLSSQPQPSINQIFFTNETTDKTEHSEGSLTRISVQLMKNCACCQGNTAIAQCMHCNDYLCQQCVQIHEGLGHTKKHPISYLDDVKNKAMASVSEAASGTWNQRSVVMDKQLSPDSFNSTDLLESATKLEQLNFNDQEVSSETPSNPASSRVVGTGRYSFSSGHSLSNRSSSNSTNVSLENLRYSSGGETPTERTSESESAAAALAYKRSTLPVTSSSDFSTNNFVPSNLYPAPSTCSSTPTIVGLDFDAPSMSYPNFSNAILQVMAAPIDYFPVSDDCASILPFVPLSNEISSMCHSSRWPLCLRHHRPFAYFCTSCMLPACAMCRQLDHSTHSIIEIREAVQNVKLFSLQIVDQIRQTMFNFRQSLDQLQRIFDETDAKVNQAAANINQSIRKCSSTLNSKKSKEILIKIKHALQTKVYGIVSQMETIKYYSLKLAQARDSITDHSKFTSPFEAIIANYRAFKELTQAKNFNRCSASSTVPLEDDASYLLHNGQVGALANTFHPIHTTYNNSNVFHQDSTDGNNLELSMLRCRPVFNCATTVTIVHYGSIPTKMWAKPGMDRGELCRPWGITCNRFGEVIVADRSNNRIQVFDSTGKYLFEFGSQGSAEGQFHKCAGVAVGPHDEIVVADKDNHRIQIFTRHGDFIFTFGSEGEQLGQFKFPWDVAVDSFGYILVSDTRNHRVQLFNSYGTFVAKWGGEKEPNLLKLFDSPRGVTFDPKGNIMVTDFNLHKVILIDRMTGRIRSIGREGKEKGQFSRPQGLCCDDKGCFVVVDSKNHRYQVFNEKGEFLWTVGKQGKSDPGYFDRPSDVCLDQKGHIYIVDSDNHRLQKF